jgi:hypothetical protein
MGVNWIGVVFMRVKGFRVVSMGVNWTEVVMVGVNWIGVVFIRVKGIRTGVELCWWE